jgi:hypothetical protein
VEPGAPDPLQAYFNVGGGGGGTSNPRFLDSTALLENAELNEWRSLRPGQYRVFAVSYRVTRNVAPGEEAPTIHRPEVLRSNTVDLTVEPADSAWVAEQIADAVQILSHQASDADTKQAARTLRFLNTVDSTRELARHFRGLNQQPGGWELMFGLYGSPHRQVAIDAMRAELAAPDHAITEDFLSTLVELQILADPAFDAPKFDPQRPKEMGIYWNRRNARASELKKVEARTVAAALPRKTREARARTLYGLLLAGQPDGELIAAIRPALIAAWEEMPHDIQDGLIVSHRWRIASSEMVPVLRHIGAQPPRPNGGDSTFRGAALHHLFELDPVNGHEAIRRSWRI